jgi:RNA polymerase sigma-70 factor (ECF subfamily)
LLALRAHGGTEEGMDDQHIRPSANLGDIATHWTVVRQAHAGSGTEADRAREELMERYSGAVYRYLRAALRDEHAADDLFQEFALRFLRGDFRNANPERGRFRDFVKTALYHLIVDHQNRRRVAPLRAEEFADATVPDPQFEQEFLDSWRAEILSRAWQALDESSHAAGQPFYQVLRLRSEMPELSSADMAERLGRDLGRSLTADWVRQSLRRARERFTTLLVDELARSLDEPSRERLEQELIDLGLFAYCQDALKRR